MGFVPDNPTTFDIKSCVLSGLNDNPFIGNTIRDPWEHLARYYETTSMCRLTSVTDDQVKLRLFNFSLIRRAKDWLLCILNRTIVTCKELEDKFMEQFFTIMQFLREGSRSQSLSNKRLNPCMTHVNGLNC